MEFPMLVPPPLLPRPDPCRRRLLRLYDRLHRRYGPQRWWPARSRFEVVVGAILTQNGAWRNAERAIARLREAGALDLRAMLALHPARLTVLLRPSGTFRVKARRLRAFALHVARRHKGRLGGLLALALPALRAELRGIAGVGAETADAIALYAAGRPIFVVDAYTRRILARHRLVTPDADYATVQTLLMTHLPHDPALFNEFHALLVRVGKEHCRARPRCEGCPLRFDLRGRRPRL
jgi:endonuclease-3 related protein